MTQGWKTSEFYLTIAAQVLGAILATGIINPTSNAAKIFGVVAAALAAMGYSYGRSLVKVSNAPYTDTPLVDAVTSASPTVTQ